jgi:catechol 2,3-dioxygenase-like lactoylglutathione lyase family enzyme
MRIHHIGIYVTDMGKSVSQYAGLGFEKVGDEICFDRHDNVNLILLRNANNDMFIELVEKAEKGASPTSRPEIHHICCESGDFDTDKLSLLNSGFLLFKDERPAPLFGGKRICWFFGSGAGIVELKEQ